MTTTMHMLVRTLSVAALLAAATISLPAGAVHAEQKHCPPVKTDPHGGKGGGGWVPGSKFGTGNKTYICDDDGSWIIITDAAHTEPGGPVPTGRPHAGTGGPRADDGGLNPR
jgi:hypothetical protein